MIFESRLIGRLFLKAKLMKPLVFIIGFLLLMSCSKFKKERCYSCAYSEPVPGTSNETIDTCGLSKDEVNNYENMKARYFTAVNYQTNQIGLHYAMWICKEN